MATVWHRTTRLNRAFATVAKLVVLTLILGSTSAAGFGVTPALAGSASCTGSLGTRTPVLLVHGYNSSEATWGESAFTKLCSTRTFVTTFNYGIPSQGENDPSLEWVTDSRIGPALAKRIADLAGQSTTNGGYGKVVLVAHSMGGLAIRCALDFRCDGLDETGAKAVASDVGTVVTFGTPNEGSFWKELPRSITTGTLLGISNFYCLDERLIEKVVAVEQRQFFKQFCQYAAAINGGAASALTPGSQELRALAHLPKTVPLAAVAGWVEMQTTVFYHDLDVEDEGDLVVAQPSAKAEVRSGTSDSTHTVPCGVLNLSAFDMLLGPGVANHLANGTKIVLPSCWHVTETNDDTFLANANAAIDKWINDNTPAVPGSLTATALSTTSVRLNWQNESSTESGFRVYVNNASTPPVRAAKTTSTVVAELEPSTQYCFKVEAFNPLGSSGQSAARCATTQAVKPLATSLDLRNATYKSDCGGEAQTELSVTLSNGAGKVAKPDSYSPGATYDFALSPVQGTEAATAAGDLTGDTHPEVAALLSCWESDTSPNFRHWEIQVFTDGPTRLAVVVPIPDAGFQRVDSEQVSIVDRKLVVGVGLYGPDDCNGCGPSVHRSYTWRWDGHQFVRIGG